MDVLLILPLIAVATILSFVSSPGLNDHKLTHGNDADDKDYFMSNLFEEKKNRIWKCGILFWHLRPEVLQWAISLLVMQPLNTAPAFLS